MIWAALVAGALLGILSRVEEAVAGFAIGLSTNPTWLALAFVVGAAGRRSPRAGATAIAGAVALTAANAGYYAWVAVTEPERELATVAGSPLRWLVLGVAGGAVFAIAGRLWARGHGATRVLACLPLAGVCVVDGLLSLGAGHAGGAVALVAGVMLVLLSARAARERALAVALATTVVGVALTGRLDALLP